MNIAYLLTNVVLQENLLDLGSDGLGVQLVGEGGHLVQTGGGGEGRAAQPRPHRQHLAVGGQGVQQRGGAAAKYVSFGSIV